MNSYSGVVPPQVMQANMPGKWIRQPEVGRYIVGSKMLTCIRALIRNKGFPRIAEKKRLILVHDLVVGETTSYNTTGCTSENRGDWNLLHCI